MNVRKLMGVLGCAVAFGAIAAIVKGQSGDGVTLLSRFRADVGNLSTPWLLIAWFAGSRTRRLPLAAGLGLAATLVALLAFYLVSGLVEPGGSGAVAGVGSWVGANRVYFMAGAISGPVFGLLGGWWGRRRSPHAPLVAGILLFGEPVVLSITGAVLSNGVLSPRTGLPLVVRIVPAFGLSGAAPDALAVYAGEMALGAALVAVAVRSAHRARLGDRGAELTIRRS